MTKFKLIFLLLVSALSANTVAPGQLVWFYTTTDVQLLHDIESARSWQTAARLWGEHDMEIFFRGVEYHAQSQYDDLWRHIAP